MTTRAESNDIQFMPFIIALVMVIMSGLVSAFRANTLRCFLDDALAYCRVHFSPCFCRKRISLVPCGLTFKIVRIESAFGSSLFFVRTLMNYPLWAFSVSPANLVMASFTGGNASTDTAFINTEIFNRLSGFTLEAILNSGWFWGNIGVHQKCSFLVSNPGR